MTAKPRKPLLVNLTWAAALLLGLAVLYVGAYVGSYALWGAGLIDFTTINRLARTVFLPLDNYGNSNLPGGLRFGHFCFAVYRWAEGDTSPP